jgi:hypothetical protein
MLLDEDEIAGQTAELLLKMELLLLKLRTRVPLLLHGAELLQNSVSQKTLPLWMTMKACCYARSTVTVAEAKEVPAQTAQVAAALWCARCSCCHLVDVVAEYELKMKSLLPHR